MSRSRAGAVALVLTLVAAGATASPQQSGDEFRWSGRVGPGQTVEVRNLNGAISAEPASGDSVEIFATKEGRDRARVSVEVVEHADGITVCSIYEDRDEPNVCAPGGESHLSNGDRLKASIQFEIRMPRGVHFDANTMNGSITADDLDGNAELTTMNGAIQVSTSGWVSAKTMNGAVTATFGSTDWDGSIELESMNGAVTVNLPAGASTEISARTMNGRVQSDFDSVESRGRRRNRASGTIGSGGRRLDLSSMNGSIRIRRGD